MAELSQAEARGIDMGPLRSSLGFLLRLGQLTSFEDFYTGLADLGLRPGEFSVMIILYRNPGIRQGVLAQRLMIKRAHMTKMIRTMEDAGLVERAIPEDDRRSVELRLTGEGQNLVARHLPRWRAHEARPKETLSAAEEADLLRLLRKYLDLPEDGAK
ncbi:MarR family winged helix-turn-helix transcriptional regulator [Plastorhodobacter daqingensis]|uniref:MarR family winged helix-turn-helix transcriptional regulator n=1 Tax=Plastorhodobacter daqingensis TaxID=1387281 RepID=A0ABW2ULG5_9RHOB